MMAMRSVGVCLVLVLGSVLLNVSAHPAAAQQNSAETQLLQIERDWCAAGLKKDAGALDRILAADASLVGIRGRMQGKSEFLADLKDTTSSVTACSDTNMKVRVYGDTAIVTGEATRSGTLKGAPYKDRRALWTDVFVKKDGRWQCVATQSTLIADQQK
jgi:ketosteroid isomerase-like protein